MDEFGDHMLGCKSSLPTRSRLWHGPLAEVWLVLSRVAGLSCRKEVRNLMLHSGKRPDVAILGAFRSNLILMFGLSWVLTRGTAPPPPSSLGTGPFGMLRGRTGPGLVARCRSVTLSSRSATRPEDTWATQLTTSSA